MKKVMVKLLILIFLGIVTLIYGLFQGGFVSWFLFYSFLPFALYSFFLFVYPIQLFRVKRVINKKQFQKGERLEATIIITRRFPVPLAYFAIEEVLPSQLKHCEFEQLNRGILFPWFKRTIILKYVINSLPRGEHTFSTIRLKIGDFLGFIEKEHFFPVKETVIVFPKIVDIQYRQLNNQYNQGTSSSNLKIHRDTTIAVGVREYKPGDKPTWIDWKSMARKNTMLTKEFEQQQSHDVLIIMDRANSEWFEEAVVFAASLTKAILQKEVKTGFISVGAGENHFPILNGAAHFQNIYYHLAGVQSDAKIPFSKVIVKEKEKYHGLFTYVIITTVLTLDLVESIERLAVQNKQVMLFVVKESASLLTNHEKQGIEVLKKQNVFTSVIGKESFSNVFLGVGQTRW